MALKGLLPALLILLVGATFRFHALFQDARFHPDEALFATFARKAAVNGDWLLHGALDKTPLLIYADALSMMLMGVRPLPNGVLTLDIHAGEFTARLPGTLASILLIAVMYAIARTLYDRDTIHRVRLIPLLAMFLTAVSPYALAFSATAFTDGLMLLCVTLALWMNARGKWLWAGLWLALGFACKQQALFYLPLVLLIGWRMSTRTKRALSVRRCILFSAPLIVCFLLLAAWDTSRGEITGIWALAVENNDPGGFVRAIELIPRLSTWAGYLGYMTGAGWLTAFLLLLAITALVFRVVNQWRTKSTQIDIILALYVLVYVGFHWLVTFPTHDRYPLLILPLILLLIARGMEWVWERVVGLGERTLIRGGSKTLPYIALLCIAVLCFFLPALDASEGRIGIGGDQGENTGIDRVAAYLDTKPLGTIVYDHWLGWELGYYLGTWSDKRLTYYPNPVALADDARAQTDPAARYFVAPVDVPVDVWLDALQEAGFRVVPDFRTERQIVYRLTREMMSR